MNKKVNKSSSILDKLESMSSAGYKEVERRMCRAAQIADAMESQGLSKKQFADKMGKSPSQITKWLSGTHNFTDKTLNEISIALGVNLNCIEPTNKVYDIEVSSYSALSQYVQTGTCNIAVSRKLALTKSKWQPYSSNKCCAGTLSFA